MKQKCCRSTPKRCSDCPVVALRLHKIEKSDIRGRELRRAVKAARVY
ncbi:MAG: hypothetical protein H7Y15_14620 [Pseudonocardia sp.]|nr:hypothetical protein [Pseudonocardia sp.]